MDERLYSKMQWPEIEALVYSEHDRPRQVLGDKVTDDGILIAAFNPDAVSMACLLYTSRGRLCRQNPHGLSQSYAPGFLSIKYEKE